MPRDFMRAVSVVALSAVVTLGGLWLGQRRLIYLPDPTSPPAPPGVDEVRLHTSDGLELTAWWLAGSTDDVVVVFPGNAGHRAYRLPLAEEIRVHGPGVLLVDYRGYGGNPGSPSEVGLLADARAAAEWVTSRSTRHVVYVGESLGAGPATAVSREIPPDGLVLRSPFVDLLAVAAVHYPYLPSRWLLRDRFPVAEWAASLEVPVTVVAGRSDGIVPYVTSAAVADAAGAELVTVEGADHNDPRLGWGSELVSAIVTVGR